MRFAHDTTPRNTRLAVRPVVRPVRRSVSRAIQTTLENLEPRKLLASVGGGEIGIYEGPDGPVRISVSGSGSFDFIGATRTATGQPQLNDIPMTIYDANGTVIREILGGYQGRDGLATINEVTGAATNGEMTGTQPPYVNLPSGQVSIGGLGSNVKGKTYGVNVRQQGPNNSIVEVLGVNTTDGTTNIKEDVSAKVLAALQAENPAFAAGDINGVIGADFDPNDEDILYFALDTDYPFVTGGGATPTITRKSVPAMFKYNIRGGALTLDPAFFGVGSQQDTYRIDDFTFGDDGTIYLFGSIQQGTITQVGLFTADKDSVVPQFEGAVNTGVSPTLTAINQIAAMEFIPGEDYIVFVNDRTDTARLLGLDLDNNPQQIVTDIGSVIDPDDGADQNRRGSAIGDLAFNSRLTDGLFSPGKRGVLLGTETNRDELVAFDSRQRFQTPDLYAIFGNNVNSSTSVSISAITPDSDPDADLEDNLFRGELNPYTGSAGSIRTIMPSDSLLSLPNGELYLGIRTADRTNALTIPVLGLNPAEDFAGNKPGVTFPRFLRPGVYIDGSINDFLFGGTITGSIDIEGSVDTFYAGNILTGDPSTGRTNQTANFNVGGDLRNLVVRGGLGSLDGADIEFAPGTDLLVGGRVQQIKSGGDLRGAFDFAGKSSELTYSDDIFELETTADNRVPNAAGRAFGDHNGFQPGPGLFFPGSVDKAGFNILDGVTSNDTFATPQVLGSYFSKARKTGGTVTVQGNLNNGSNFGDNVDFYGVPLLAGQSIQVGAIGEGLVFMEVVDPDGRVIASTNSNQNGALFLDKRLGVTAQQPGVYRIAVRCVDPTVLGNFYRPYTLTVDKVGEMAIGGIVSGGDTYFNRPDRGLRVRDWDLGAVLATGILEAGLGGSGYIGRDITFPNTIGSDKGNIRSLEGSSISRLDGGSYVNLPNITAPRGSVGLIRANATTVADAFLYFNGFRNNFRDTPPEQLTIGGSYQVIETIGDFSANMSANGSIGVIRVGSFASTVTNLPGYLEIDADNKGNDGTVGLVDIVRDLGSFEYGGFAVSGGAGSNVRYIRAGGTVYRDAFFGFGSTTVNSSRNAAITIRDDSGANVTLTPYAGTTTTSSTVEGGTGTGTGTGTTDPFGGSTGGTPDPFGGGTGTGIGTGTGTTPDPFGGNTDPTTSDVIVGDLRITSYPVRSGGSVIMAADSTTGLKIDVSRRGGGGSGDIAVVRSSASGFIPTPTDTGISGLPGVPIVDPANVSEKERINPSRLRSLTLGTGTTFDFLFSGGTVNVFEITDRDASNNNFPARDTTSTLQLSRVLNNTDGEIVNFRAESVGRLEAQYLGVARPVAGVKIEGLENAEDSRGATANVYPFNGAKNMIYVGRAIDILSRGPIGNIVAYDTVQNIEANSDNRNVRGVFEGVVGPIVAFGDPDVETNVIRNIDIGEGLAYSGSGDVSFGGIYSEDKLGLITNRNGGGDLRGDVITGEYLEGIQLTGGSILDADIVVTQFNDLVVSVPSAFDAGLETINYSVFSVGNAQNLSELDGIGDITISGNGGMMNSVIFTRNMGELTIDPKGFGLFTSTIFSTSEARMEGINVGGMGIRGTTYTGGSFIGNITAQGTGKLRSVSEFSKSARASEFVYFDSATGNEPNAATDLNLFLGTSKRRAKITGVTEEGVIQDSVFTANREVGNVKAFEFRAVNNPNNFRPGDATFLNRISAGDTVGDVTALRNINGLRVSSGRVGTISAGRDVLNFNLQTTERVKALKAGRNIAGSASFNLVNNGSLDTLQAGGNINGAGFVAGDIRAIIAGGDVGSASGQGGIRAGGSINLIQIGDDLSGTGYIRAGRTIKQVTIAGDIEKDATLRAKSITKQSIKGTIFGDIVVG